MQITPEIFQKRYCIWGSFKVFLVVDEMYLKPLYGRPYYGGRCSYVILGSNDALLVIGSRMLMTDNLRVALLRQVPLDELNPLYCIFLILKVENLGVPIFILKKK